MRYRTLGLTEISVSEIGFGAWGIGGPSPGTTSYGPADDGLSRRTLDRAFERGVTFYDTSNAYGNGHSEELLGQAFQSRRDRVVIATKAGYPRFDLDQDFSPEYIRRSLEGSLQRLGTDYVDLFQLHSPPLALLQGDPEILETLRQLEREGKIRAWGVSVRAPDDGAALIEQLGVPVIQVNLNLMDQRAVEIGLLSLAQLHRIGVIARTPLCFGMLSGHVTTDTLFDPRDHRSKWPKAQIARWIEGSRQFVGAVATSDRSTPAQVALRYCLSHPAITSAIPGMMRPEEVDDNAGASTAGPLNEVQMAEIARIYGSENFFVGR
jgi:aryl-alcohol dehydrogenase-like predicted oxidoreductase